MKDPTGWRIRLLLGLGLLLLAGLGCRLFVLTVQRHEALREAAERRSRRVEIVTARRGRILDRHGRPLAVDQPVWDIEIDLPRFDPALALVAPLARVLRVSLVKALAVVRAARTRAAIETERSDLTLATLSGDQTERVRRLLRRSRLRWRRTETRVFVIADVDLLRARATGLTHLARLLERPRIDLDRAIQARVQANFEIRERPQRLNAWLVPLAVVENASFALVARVRERAFDLRGVEVQRRYVRRYPQQDCAVHVVGYVQGPTPNEAQRDQAAGIVLDGGRARDILLAKRNAKVNLEPQLRLRKEAYGRTGVECTRDTELRGRPGLRVVVRDVKNNVRELITNAAPQDGRDIRLTLDVPLQRAAEAALDRAVVDRGEPDSGGALAVVDLREGDVLALASSPRYDPNTLGQRYRQLLRNPRQPLRHRPASAMAPASTLKVAMSFAIHDARRERALALGWRPVCQGKIYKGRRGQFSCEGLHGEIGLVRALKRSCNHYYFHAADSVGLDALAQWSVKLGVGQRLVPGLFNEQPGVFPVPGYKKKRLDRQSQAVAHWERKWNTLRAAQPRDPEQVARVYKSYQHRVAWLKRFAQDATVKPGDARNAIIGQGDVTVTPIQLAHQASLVALGGDAPLPRLLADDAPRFRRVVFDPSVLRLVRQGLRQVVSSPGGTAAKPEYGLCHLDVAGKTGTAQRGTDKPYLAWFMGYYPASAPEIAFAVVVDRTRGHGGDVCVPLVRKVLEAYERSRSGSLRRSH